MFFSDMQNDYTTTYNMETYGYIKNPWAGDLTEAADEIVRVIEAPNVYWDMIVFSQDWLIPSIMASIGKAGKIDFPRQSFCIANTEGAEPMTQLLDAAARVQPKQLLFTKNQDNLFNTIQVDPDLGPNFQKKVDANSTLFPPVPSWYPLRGFDSNNTYGGKVFNDVLSEHGYTPENTKLTMVGTEADVCVLTSTILALDLGYDVQVYVPGINPNELLAVPEWTACTSDGKVGSEYAECCVPTPSQIRDLPANNTEWRDRATHCQVGPGFVDTLDYMQLAGYTALHSPQEPHRDCFSVKEVSFHTWFLSWT